MNKIKYWIISAISLVLVGSIIFIGVMTMLNWDFSKLSTVKYDINDYDIEQQYKNISIDTKTADIVFELTDKSDTFAECVEQKNAKHSFEVKDGTLYIKLNDQRKWYEYIGISFNTQKITVHIPKGEYGELLINSDTSNIVLPKELKFENVDISVSTGDVKNSASILKNLNITTSTGDIDIDNITAEKIDLSVSTGRVNASSVVCKGDFSVNVSTGKINFSDIKCKNIFSKGSTGNVNLKNVIASELFEITRSTGKVTLDKCDAKELNITTDTGDVKGTLLSDKIFIIRSDTGRINVPKTVSGGKCEITTDTGDILINIE